MNLTSEPLAQRYRAVRDMTMRIAAPLSAEDCMLQSMPDASPTLWHLAHTTWFFEQFLLVPQQHYQPFDASFHRLFNSYYNALGKQYRRAQRGMLSRPGLQCVRQYRQHVDEHLQQLLDQHELPSRAGQLVELGLHHEQQHQELMLTDIKHALFQNPTLPAYDELPLAPSLPATQRWHECDDQLAECGHSGMGFGFDNEFPRHQVMVPAFSIAQQLVTCGEFLEFIEDGGYQRPDHWLSLGWDECQQHQWQAPLYWQKIDGRWFQYTLAGLKPLEAHHPVCHVSYFEADAFARWSGFRLPTEFEWELTASRIREMPEGQFADELLADGQAIHPTGAVDPVVHRPAHLCGTVWEWTSSSYAPYPGYRAPPGALGEYNGKFMCNQYVLRGGSVATSRSHIRISYRNFFAPAARWQFAGLRLARSPARCVA